MVGYGYALRGVDVSGEERVYMRRESLDPAMPNYVTIHGKAYPCTDVIRMKVGQTVTLRFIGSSNNFIHPMHLHGGPFEVVALDGEVLPEHARYLADTVNVVPVSGTMSFGRPVVQATGCFTATSHITPPITM